MTDWWVARLVCLKRERKIFLYGKQEDRVDEMLVNSLETRWSLVDKVGSAIALLARDNTMKWISL